MMLCPCGSERDYDDCCGPIIAGVPALTAEALVRSRYTAFVKGALDHVERTHAPEVREDFNRAEAERVAQQYEWRGLEIRRVIETGDTAKVEFVVRFRREQQETATMSASSFRRDDGQWFYVSTERSQVVPLRVTKFGRNDPCPCGSGKKAKKCCGVTTDVR
ncbi:MAG: SEC-C domain-containing protein [Candidatus Competibacter sp.]|nr:SEC-C domain-containing protein [Candidatus Competibacter sp.]